MRVCWEHVEEAPVQEIFKLYLQQNFFCISRESVDIEPEWVVFRDYIAEMAPCA